MVATGAVAIGVCAFVTLFFLRIVPLPSRAAMTIIALTWVGLPLLWAITSIVMRKKWHKTSYIIGDNHLTVRKDGFMSGVSQQMYRYDTMISLKVEQSFWGRRSGYGTLRITLPRIEDEVALSYVPDPANFAALVKDHITRGRSEIDVVGP